MRCRASLGRWVTGALVGVALLLAVGYAGVSLFTAERLTRPTNQPLRIDPRRLGGDAQAWSARTSDGVTLRGWYLSTPERRRLIVLVHGMWSSWLEMAALGRDLHRGGYDVLLFDLRGHGQSDPSRLTLGRRERADLRAVMNWAGAEGFTRDRIGWLGYSMGASTLLLEAAGNPDIQVVVMDSPYGDLPALEEPTEQAQPLTRLVQPWHPDGGPLGLRRAHRRPGADPGGTLWGNRPLLLIHGESDSIVPVSQAYQLAAAAGASCLTLTLPGVEHVQAYETDPQGYVTLIEEFFQDHLSP